MQCYCTADACNNPSSKLSDPVALKQTDNFNVNFRGSEYLDLENNYSDDEGGILEYSSADYGDDEEDDEDAAGGSGDYPDDSDMTDPPPTTSLEIEDKNLTPKVSTVDKETINDLEFDEEADSKAEEEDKDKIDVIKTNVKNRKGTKTTSDAQGISPLGIQTLIIAIMSWRGCDWALA